MITRYPRRALKVPEVAETLGVHPRTIYRLIRTGRLRAVRVDRMFLIPTDALDKFLEAAESTGMRRDGEAEVVSGRR